MSNYKKVIIYNHTRTPQIFPIPNGEKIILAPATKDGPSKNYIPDYCLDFLRMDIIVNKKSDNLNQKFTRDKDGKALTEKRQSYFMDFVQKGLITIGDYKEQKESEVKVIAKGNKKKSSPIL